MINTEEHIPEDDAIVHDEVYMLFIDNFYYLK